MGDYYVNVIDWEGVKGTYKVIRLRQYDDNVFGVAFHNSSNDVEVMTVTKDKLIGVNIQ